jgi:hypothetical protein
VLNEILEYAVGAATVSVGWSGYFSNVVNQIIVAVN